jgi:hypothetical protein
MILFSNYLLHASHNSCDSCDSCDKSYISSNASLPAVSGTGDAAVESGTGDVSALPGTGDLRGYCCEKRGGELAGMMGNSDSASCSLRWIRASNVVVY